ncbi:MAG: molybdate ABC transporter substrate-binding protein [Polyangiales bacterium]
MRNILGFSCAIAVWLSVASAHADDLSVAVAANFLGTLQKLGVLFQRVSGHTLQPSPGSSGQLYAQIQRGAPYDVLLSADADRPAKLEAEGLTVKGSRFTYATGRLVLWSPKGGVVEGSGDVLKKPELKYVALPDPKTAPYGVAAEQVLTALKLLAPLRAANKVVVGESVAQAHQFAVSGHADCAFVALSQVLGAGGKITGSSWLVPDALYTKIDQDAVALKSSTKPALAQQFLTWLRTDSAALTLIRDSGYATAKP